MNPPLIGRTYRFEKESQSGMKAIVVNTVKSEAVDTLVEYVVHCDALCEYTSPTAWPKVIFAVSLPIWNSWTPILMEQKNA